MEQFFLIFHLGGAAAMAGVAAVAIVKIIRRNLSAHRSLSFILSGGLFFQVLTGSLLALTQAGPSSPLIFCGKISAYLAGFLILQSLFFWQVKTDGGSLPIRIAGASASISIIAVIFTLAIKIGSVTFF